jgi:putative radical SAM enzyme (TIGR03279 family)
LKSNGLLVKSVLIDSIAFELGIEKDDFIVSINGEYIKDIFDYQFLIIGVNINLCFVKQDGEQWEAEIEKDEYDDLGIEFDEDTQIASQSCNNKCIFCFIDQLPKNMRKTLYFKDDDSRMSFLFGNYITLSNMSNSELERIISYRMSPLNVSVHTTNSDLRIFMMRNKNAGDIMKKLRRLTLAGIEINCQIVLCKGINDGRELDYSINHLISLYPKLISISVVPVGLTKYREGLSCIEEFTPEDCKIVINQIEKKQKLFRQMYKSSIVFLADEWYVKADVKLPSKRHYEDFPQLENGVGMLALFKAEFLSELKKISKRKEKNSVSREISIATGVAAYKVIRELCDQLELANENLKINLYKITNDFFGENITVTGLLTGQDIANQLEGKNLGQVLFLSSNMFKSDEDILVDDYSKENLSLKLGVDIEIVENSGDLFLDRILGIKNDEDYLKEIIDEMY